jgi:predicted lipoprotein with Yx(FWY)xxD motif
MRNPRTTLAIIALAAAATIGGVTIAARAGGSIPNYYGSPTKSSTSSPAAPNRSGTDTLHTSRATVQGTPMRILVDAKGLPLYIYKPDTATTSQVTGQLAAFWPPLVSSAPTAHGATGTLAAVATTNGQQVAYNGHFLYTFVQDKPGQVTGQGVQNFFVATPGISTKVSTHASTSPGPVSNGYY